MPAGYSNTPLIKKLGIKDGFSVLILDEPSDYPKALGRLPEGVKLLGRVGKAIDFVQFFVTRRAQLEKRFERLAASLVPAGIFWVCWPKKTAGVESDLTRDVIREIGLSHGLVDVKICAVDETWSGLKFVRRLRDR